MPWEIRKNGNQYCIYKQGTDKPLVGGCHETRAEAVEHMQALYASEKRSYVFIKNIDNETATVAGWGVVFGGQDLTGETFTPTTDFWMNYVPDIAVLYDHRQNQVKHVIGHITQIEQKDYGVWLEAELSRHTEYVEQVLELIQKGALGWSSGSVPHLVIKDAGEIKAWPIVEFSLTPTPAEPRTLGVQRLKSGNSESSDGRRESGAAGRKPGRSNKINFEEATTMKGLLDKIKILVPGLSEEQYAALGAVLELTGAGPVEDAAPSEDEEMASGDAPMRGVSMEQLRTVLGKLGIKAETRGTAVARPPFAPDKQEQEEEKGRKTFNALYNLRYGNTDEAVKAVLADLHGQNFEQKRFSQAQAFNRYLRGGETGLKSGDDALLHEVILSPDYAKKAIAEGWDIAALKTNMVEGIDSLGGVVVPVDFQSRIIERLQGMTVVRGRAFQQNTSRDRVEYPTLTGGDSQYTSAVRVTWVDEVPTAGTAATNLTFGMEGIPVHTVMAETFLSRNVVEDSIADLGGLLARKFAEAAAIDEDNQFLTGNSVGRPAGILVGSSPATGITTVNSGAATALAADGLLGLCYAIDSQYRRNAVWIAEKASALAIRKLKDGEGNYLWERDFQAGQPSPLLGYPFLEQESMPTIAASAYPVIFGDLGGYTIVDRIGMTVERYLDSSTARQNLVLFIMRRRLGGQVTEPWRFAAQYISA